MWPATSHKAPLTKLLEVQQSRQLPLGRDFTLFHFINSINAASLSPPQSSHSISPRNLPPGAWPVANKLRRRLMSALINALTWALGGPPLCG